MTENSPISHEITTINYTLSWPHLQHPSNTTFAGATQIDLCNCGSAAGQRHIGLDHIYTRYSCARPKVRFATPDEDLWVLYAPLGQVNLLRPAIPSEIARRAETHDNPDPDAFRGKNFLLLTGPCPRGRYQAYATWLFLKSLPPAARESIECLSLLIQPYEEDCSDDRGGRAYVALAQYILQELPAFNTLCLNIWGEETKFHTREFGMLLWREGIKIVVSWDWWGEKTEVYKDVDDFLKGIEEGVVGGRPPWEGLRHKHDAEEDEDGGHASIPYGAASRHASRSSSRETSIYRGQTSKDAQWGIVSADSEDGSQFTDDFVEIRTPVEVSFEDDWSDALLTPLSPDSGSADGESAWQKI